MARISKIKLRNFKSFKRATIPISKGFTVIVGPNGAGKSNIIDGVCFALGIGTSKALRAQRLHDLIFHGQKSGEVEIELEDGEKSYVVSRSIDEKGQSIFKLDGKRKTKKEIEDFLASLGIKEEAHQIIMQGDVDAFVKMNAKQRRQIIDDISGISEYEEKKAEALRELEKVEGKIRDVRIVLNERIGYLKTLEEEKREAEEFLRLKERAKDLRTTILNWELKEWERKMERVLKEIEKRTREGEEIAKKREELERLKEQTELEIKRLEDKVLSGKGEEVKVEIEIIKSRIKDCENKKAELEGNIRRLEEKKKGILEEIEKLSGRVRVLEQTLETYIKNEREIGEKLGRALKELEKVKKEIGENVKKAYAEYEKISKIIEEKREERQRLLGELRLLEEKIALLEREWERFEMEKKKVEEKRRKGEELRKELNELEEKRERLKAELERVRNEIKGKKNELRKWEKMAVKVGEDVVKYLRGKIAVFGKVGDLIEYDDKYALAVEAAGGNKLHYIVVPTLDDALKGVEILREKGKRASFIPLDKIKPKKGGNLVNVLEYDKKVEKAIEYVFGDTDIVENLREATRRAVTLQGDVIEKSGVVTGGKIERVYPKKVFEAIDKLEKEIKELENLEGDLEREGADTEIRVREIKFMLPQFEKLSLAPPQPLEPLFKEKEEIEKKVKELEKEIGEMIERRGKIKKVDLEEVKKAENAVKGLEREWDEIKKEIERVKWDIEMKREKIKELKENVGEIEEEIGVLKERIVDLEKEKSSLQDVLKKKEEELNNYLREWESVFKKKEELEKRLKEIGVQIGELRRRWERTQNKLTKLAEEKGSIQGKVVDLKWEVERIGGNLVEGNIEDLKKELDDIEQKLASMEPNLKAIEMYEEELGKVEEIKEKLQKLEEEKDEIMRAIEEIEKKKKDVFSEAFAVLNHYFDYYFKELYGEGSYARLKLEDPEHPLQSGLLLEAKIGKKPPINIDALSGGEKALTALAFLFAVQSYKPSPFYILDEADASLDKINSERLAKMIKKFASKIQYIVVCHNPVIVEMADQVVGVHRGEDGSSLVEIDLKKYK